MKRRNDGIRPEYDLGTPVSKLRGANGERIEPPQHRPARGHRGGRPRRA